MWTEPSCKVFHTTYSIEVRRCFYYCLLDCNITVNYVINTIPVCLYNSTRLLILDLVNDRLI